MKQDLEIGQRVKLAHGASTNLFWTVQALDDRFVILTRQAPFRPKGQSQYTIIDWERGVRGPCNLIGQGWDIDEPNGPEDLLQALNNQLEIHRRLDAGEKSVSIDDYAVEVSHRNSVPVEIVDRRSAA